MSRPLLLPWIIRRARLAITALIPRGARVASLALAMLAVSDEVCRAQRGVPGGRSPSPPPVRPVHPVGPHHSGQGGGDIDWATTALVGAGVLGGGLTLFVGLYYWLNRTVGYVRIVQPPPGEAPEEIRRAWVGLDLPLQRGASEPRQQQSLGVLSGRAPEVGTGFLVSGNKAITALASHAPEAASWRRQHAPHVLSRGFRLFFPVEVSERVG